MRKDDEKKRERRKRKSKGRRTKEEEEKEKEQTWAEECGGCGRHLLGSGTAHPLFSFRFLFAFLGVCCLLTVTFISSARQGAPPAAGADPNTKPSKPTITRNRVSRKEVRGSGEYSTRVPRCQTGRRYGVRVVGITRYRVPHPWPAKAGMGASYEQRGQTSAVAQLGRYGGWQERPRERERRKAQERETD